MILPRRARPESLATRPAGPQTAAPAKPARPLWSASQASVRTAAPAKPARPLWSASQASVRTAAPAKPARPLWSASQASVRTAAPAKPARPLWSASQASAFARLSLFRHASYLTRADSPDSIDAGWWFGVAPRPGRKRGWGGSRYGVDVRT